MNSLTLFEWVLLAEITARFSIVVGIIIGLFQLRSLRDQRRAASVINWKA